MTICVQAIYNMMDGMVQNRTLVLYTYKRTVWVWYRYQYQTLPCTGKGRQFLKFELAHPDSAGESNPKTYLEKAVFDISKRKRIFRL